MGKLDVEVCRSVGGRYASAIIDAEEIIGVKWDNVSGGIHKKQNGYSLYGYIPYSRAVELGLDCSGMHDRGYNDAKICIPESINRKEHKEGYKYLRDEAGKKPVNHRKTVAHKPCTKMILELLSESSVMERGELRDKILEFGYEGTTFRNAIRTLIKTNRIVTEGTPQSPHQKITRVQF